MSKETVGAQINTLSMYFHLMSDDDKDYLNCARIAMEEQIEWRF
jgi:hypothetical protein